MNNATKLVERSTSGQGDQGFNSESKDRTNKQEFFVVAINMSWQLAIVVLVPIIGGVQLDKVFGHTEVYIFIGLAIAVVGSAFVLWRTMQAANRLPVPKLTAQQKQAIKKAYEDEDEDNE
jgi:dipeptide/tripeptide permease